MPRDRMWSGPLAVRGGGCRGASGERSGGCPGAAGRGVGGAAAGRVRPRPGGARAGARRSLWGMSKSPGERARGRSSFLWWPRRRSALLDAGIAAVAALECTASSVTYIGGRIHLGLAAELGIALFGAMVGASLVVRRRWPAVPVVVALIVMPGVPGMVLLLVALYTLAATWEWPSRRRRVVALSALAYAETAGVILLSMVDPGDPTIEQPPFWGQLVLALLVAMRRDRGPGGDRPLRRGAAAADRVAEGPRARPGDRARPAGRAGQGARPPGPAGGAHPDRPGDARRGRAPGLADGGARWGAGADRGQGPGAGGAERQADGRGGPAGAERAAGDPRRAADVRGEHGRAGLADRAAAAGGPVPGGRHGRHPDGQRQLGRSSPARPSRPPTGWCRRG